MSDLVVLLGYMGSGKSSVGEVLADKTGKPFIDLDHFIEQKLSKTISKIFEEDGIIRFREIEHHALSELLQNNKRAIISLGGGTPCYYNNMSIVNEYAQSIYLQGSVPMLSTRLFKERSERPLIKNINSMEELQEFVGKHLFERSQFYLKADHTINIDHKKVDEIVEEVITTLG